MLAAPACEPIRGLPKNIQIVARSKSYTVLTNLTKYGLDGVTQASNQYFENLQASYIIARPLVPLRQAIKT